MSDPVIGVLLTRLEAIIYEQITENIKLVVSVNDELDKLKNTLKAIQAVILDAEKKQVKEASIRLWLQNLWDISYDLDDVLSDWSTAIFKFRMERLENKTPKKTVSFFITFPCFCFGHIVERRDIALRIKDLNERLDRIDVDRKRYSLSNTPSSNEVIENHHAIAFVDESRVRGRDKDRTNLVNKLLREKEKRLNRVSVVGMGGIGKTTLAQLAYNSPEVIAHFDLRSWVVVSQPFDKVRVAKAILENMENKAPDLCELETLLRRVRELIKGKKFLLVLDDAWSDEFRDWEPLIDSLGVGYFGSTILVTTKNERVAKCIRCNEIIKLGLLSDDDCWELFCQYAFLGKNEEDFKNMEAIGRMISNKCKGLPLAAKTIGGLLCFKNTVQEWQNVLESGTWKEEESVTAGIFPPLLLSYYALPPTLRRCFSYCAIFPKDTVIEADNLIKLWMAHGYLFSNRNEDMEVIGRRNLENLAMRCFFQDLRKDKVSDNIIQFKMHDMIHDLAEYLTTNECSLMEVDSNLESRMKSSQRQYRHLTMVRSEDVSFPTSVGNFTKLHSLWVQSYHNCPNLVNGPDKFSPDFFQKLLHLKVFNIARNRIQELPKDIVKLLNLRYLNLSHNPLFELPETVCELYNLLTLKLVACKHLEILPKGIGKLTKLRHLEIDHTDRLTKLPKGIGKLCSLQTLTKFVLTSIQDCEETCNLGDLKNLNKLRGCLKIEGLGYAANVDDAYKSELKKKQLVDVHMDFKTDYQSYHLIENVVEPLELNPDVQFLTMSFYGGIHLPSWIGFLNNLRTLKLLNCVNCTKLPPLGKLQSLETLCIKNMHGVKRIGAEFLGVETYNNNGGQRTNGVRVNTIDVFPKLKKLKFKGMPSWEEWDVTNAVMGIEDGNLRFMPCLIYLKVYDCSKLKEVPEILVRKALKVQIKNC